MAVENKVHMHDLHATILHQLGLDHKQLTFRHDGRDFRLTDVHGHVVHESWVDRGEPEIPCVRVLCLRVSHLMSFYLIK